jgi:probable phosphoglycerate mutase
MRILIVRHGDPNYEIDSLTERGWREARLAAERISKMDIKEFYLSPFGRAQDTANCTLEKMGRTGITYDWLREFWPRIHRPDQEIMKGCWDWLPADWTKEPKFYDVNTWADVDVMQEGNVKDAYEYVCNSFDEVLKKHGYVREHNYYRVEQANDDTIVFFCHFGTECVLLSRLLNISPMPLWHGFCAAPTSVTTVYTEERRKGIASWRVSAFGDISHLYVADEEPAFAARFCECYDNMDERHD